MVTLVLTVRFAWKSSVQINSRHFRPHNFKYSVKLFFQEIPYFEFSIFFVYTNN